MLALLGIVVALGVLGCYARSIHRGRPDRAQRRRTAAAAKSLQAAESSVDQIIAAGQRRMRQLSRRGINSSWKDW